MQNCMSSMEQSIGQLDSPFVEEFSRVGGSSTHGGSPGRGRYMLGHSLTRTLGTNLKK